MARVTHSLGRDGNGLLVQLVQAGSVFTLQRQADMANVRVVSIMLTAEQIRDMNSVANPAPKP